MGSRHHNAGAIGEQPPRLIDVIELSDDDTLPCTSPSPPVPFRDSQIIDSDAETLHFSDDDTVICTLSPASSRSTVLIDEDIPTTKGNLSLLHKRLTQPDSRRVNAAVNEDNVNISLIEKELLKIRAPGKTSTKKTVTKQTRATKQDKDIKKPRIRKTVKKINACANKYKEVHNKKCSKNMKIQNKQHDEKLTEKNDIMVTENVIDIKELSLRNKMVEELGIVVGTEPQSTFYKKKIKKPKSILKNRSVQIENLGDTLTTIKNNELKKPRNNRKNINKGQNMKKISHNKLNLKKVTKQLNKFHTTITLKNEELPTSTSIKNNKDKNIECTQNVKKYFSDESYKNSLNNVYNFQINSIDCQLTPPTNNSCTRKNITPSSKDATSNHTKESKNLSKTKKRVSFNNEIMICDTKKPPCKRNRVQKKENVKNIENMQTNKYLNFLSEPMKSTDCDLKPTHETKIKNCALIDNVRNENISKTAPKESISPASINEALSLESGVTASYSPNSNLYRKINTCNGSNQVRDLIKPVTPKCNHLPKTNHCPNSAISIQNDSVNNSKFPTQSQSSARLKNVDPKIDNLTHQGRKNVTNNRVSLKKDKVLEVRSNDGNHSTSVDTSFTCSTNLSQSVNKNMHTIHNIPLSNLLTKTNEVSPQPTLSKQTKNISATPQKHRAKSIPATPHKYLAKKATAQRKNRKNNKTFEFQTLQPYPLPSYSNSVPMPALIEYLHQEMMRLYPEQQTPVQMVPLQINKSNQHMDNNGYQTTTFHSDMENVSKQSVEKSPPRPFTGPDRPPGLSNVLPNNFDERMLSSADSPQSHWPTSPKPPNPLYNSFSSTHSPMIPRIEKLIDQKRSDKNQHTSFLSILEATPYSYEFRKNGSRTLSLYDPSPSRSSSALVDLPSNPSQKDDDQKAQRGSKKRVNKPGNKAKPTAKKRKKDQSVAVLSLGKEKLHLYDNNVMNQPISYTPLVLTSSSPPIVNLIIKSSIEKGVDHKPQDNDKNEFNNDTITKKRQLNLNEVDDNAIQTPFSHSFCCSTLPIDLTIKPSTKKIIGKEKKRSKKLNNPYGNYPGLEKPALSSGGSINIGEASLRQSGDRIDVQNPIYFQDCDTVNLLSEIDRLIA